MLPRYPDLEIEIDVTPGDALQSFSDYDIQFVITSQDLPDSKHVARRIFTVPRALYAAPALLDRLGEPASPAELEGWPCLSGRNENVWQFIDGAAKTRVFMQALEQTLIIENE